MGRAVMWLNLYGCLAVRCKLKKGVKMHLAWQPFRLSQINALCINLSYLPKDQSLTKKYWELGELENDIFFDFLLLGFSKKNCFCFFPMKIGMAFTWGIIYFCTMDGFFRILEKNSSELICTRLYLANKDHNVKFNLVALIGYLNDKF